MLITKDLKEKLTINDIIKLCTTLQNSNEYYFDNQGHPIFSTVLDHPETSSGSFKVYYYDETKLFHCYTRAQSYDVFEMVCRARQCEFKEAYNYIVNFFGLDKNFVEIDDNNESELSEWSIFQKIDDYNNPREDNSAPLGKVNENILECFYPLAAPIEWQREGIIPEVMREYEIRLDSALSKIIIPHRDIDGNLVGIRGRSYNPIDLLEGKKYMPVFIEGECYNHSLGKNLYGLDKNKETIKRIKKAFVCEGEKGVLQLASFYGTDNCWAVATCGSSFSKTQMQLLLDLGVEEIVLAYDREFQGLKGEQDTVAYEDKLMKIIVPLLPYVNVSVIMDYEHLTPYKASPTDCGREIFEKLYKNRVKLYTETEEHMIKRRRNNGRIY